MIQIFLEDLIVPFRGLLLQGSKDKNLATPPSLISWLLQATRVSDTLRGNPVSGLAGHIHVQLLLFIHILLRRDVKDKGKRSDFTIRV